MVNNAYEAGKKLLLGGYSQYTPTGKSNFVQNGCYGKEPKAGATIYFYSNTMGRVCHVGGVIEVNKQGNNRYHIKTVEGNTSSGSGFDRNGGCVAIKEYSFNLTEVGGKNRINGFGYPNFNENTCTVNEFIEVLKGEVGYVEKASNKSLDDKKANPGDKNYTKYGAWYGGNGLYWCQQLISWCAWKACKKHLESASTGWINEDNRWKYRFNGVVIKDQWLLIDGRWFVFDGSGYSITGWFKSNEDWYYLNKDDGAMLSGQWILDNNKSYYLSKSGIMAKNCYVKSKEKDLYYWIGEDGAWDSKFDAYTPNLRDYELVE